VDNVQQAADVVFRCLLFDVLNAFDGWVMQGEAKRASMSRSPQHSDPQVSPHLPVAPVPNKDPPPPAGSVLEGGPGDVARVVLAELLFQTLDGFEDWLKRSEAKRSISSPTT
jgi:hypothetical protein